MSRFEPDDPGSGRGPLDVVVRSMASGDIAACAAIAAEREGDPVERWTGVFEREVDDHERVALVAESDGRVVGFGRARRLMPESSGGQGAPDGWYLTGLVVTPAARRRGVGRTLTSARLALLRGRTGQVWVFVNARNSASIELHQQLGFREVTRDFLIPGVTFEGGEGILLALDLRSRGR